MYVYVPLSHDCFWVRLYTAKPLQGHGTLFSRVLTRLFEVGGSRCTSYQWGHVWTESKDKAFVSHFCGYI